MIFRKSITRTCNNQFQIRTEKLNIKKQYKYLGEHLTETLTLAYHLKENKCQIKRIIQSCIFVLSDIVIAKIQMEPLFKLYYAVVVPAIVHSCETWITVTVNSKLTTVNQIKYKYQY